MARYMHYDYAQMKMLPIDFDRQILPGTDMVLKVLQSLGVKLTVTAA